MTGQPARWKTTPAGRARVEGIEYSDVGQLLLLTDWDVGSTKETMLAECAKTQVLPEAHEDTREQHARIAANLDTMLATLVEQGYVQML